MEGTREGGKREGGKVLPVRGTSTHRRRKKRLGEDIFRKPCKVVARRGWPKPQAADREVIVEVKTC